MIIYSTNAIPLNSIKGLSGHRLLNLIERLTRSRLNTPESQQKKLVDSNALQSKKIEFSPSHLRHLLRSATYEVSDIAQTHYFGFSANR